MAFVIADRVLETTSTLGLGPVTLSGAAAQYQSFAVGVGVANSTGYTILSGNGVDWETGLGTVTGTGPYVLSRDVVLSSSAGGSKISLAGTSIVYADVPAKRMGATPYSGALTATGTTLAGALALTAVDNYVTGGAAGAGVSLLPAAWGVAQRVHNRAGVQLNVWPNGNTETIETSAGAGTAVPYNTGQSHLFIPISSTQWLIA
jgi:hypothetical protein